MCVCVLQDSLVPQNDPSAPTELVCTWHGKGSKIIGTVTTETVKFGLVHKFKGSEQTLSWRKCLIMVIVYEK